MKHDFLSSQSEKKKDFQKHTNADQGILKGMVCPLQVALHGVSFRLMHADTRLRYERVVLRQMASI